MKRLLYIGHTYHKKTRSTLFLLNELRQCFEISECYFDPSVPADYSQLKKFSGTCFDVLVVLQVMPDTEKMRQYFSWRRGVFFPMYDHYMWGTPFYDPIWHQYVSFTVINFSRTLHDKLTACGFDSHYIQFFPEPDPQITSWGNPASVFFWQRITPLNLQLIGRVLLSFDLSKFHIHKALDPSHVFTPLSECSYEVQDFFRKITVTESDWFPGKEDMRKVMLDSALYIAPRFYEGIGMSFLEAMASGRCVVAPDCPTLNEYITHGRNGLLYSWNDPEAKLQKMSPAEIREIQQNAYDFICDGYKKWTREKSKLREWIEAPLHADSEKEMLFAKENGWIDYPLEEQPRPKVEELLPEMTIKYPAERVPGAEETPDVSVVTVVFNAVKGGRTKWLTQCLDSVQGQTGVNIEHLIIDGGSKDGTLELLTGYQNKNIPMRILSKPDKGIYDAMNRGLWLARGKYVIFLNSDDFYHNDRGLYESFRKLEETCSDFSYAPIIAMDEGKDLPVFYYQSFPDIAEVFVQMPFAHQSVMYKRESFLALHGFDISYHSSADHDSVLRMIAQGCKSCFVKGNFVSCRMGGISDRLEEYSRKESGEISSVSHDRFQGIKITPAEERNIFISKQVPHELKRAQINFLRTAFSQKEGWDDYRKIFIEYQKEYEHFKDHIKAFKRIKSFSVLFSSLSWLLLKHPWLFGKYCYYFLRERGKYSRVDAGKRAFDLLWIDFFRCCRHKKEFAQKVPGSSDG